MRFDLALPVLLSALASGLTAAVLVVVQWSRMTGIPDSTSPALWAARAYLSYFDVCAVLSFVPSLRLCQWIRSRFRTKAVR
jgi:hypothetical protein